MTDNLIKGFNYAVGLDANKLSHKIVEEKDKVYETWYDLIDIKVPKFADPSILLCPRVPTPLHHRNPRSILSEIDEEWWNRTRRRVYDSFDKRCACCGVHQDSQNGWVRGQLDAHEYYDIDYTTGEVRLNMIVPLCKYCHNYIHFGRLFAQHESGKIQDKTFYSIISHGNTILQKAGLPMKNLDPTVDDNVNNIDWSKWKMILTINGEDKEFYSLYKNQEELEKHYK